MYPIHIHYTRSRRVQYWVPYFPAWCILHTILSDLSFHHPLFHFWWIHIVDQGALWREIRCALCLTWLTRTALITNICAIKKIDASGRTQPGFCYCFRFNFQNNKIWNLINYPINFSKREAIPYIYHMSIRNVPVPIPRILFVMTFTLENKTRLSQMSVQQHWLWT